MASSTTDPLDTLEKQNGGIESRDPESRLAAQIQETLDAFHPLNSEYSCIYRVPERLRKINEEAYTPHVVSIGPFHHGKENLKGQEKIKWEHLHSFVGRNSAVTMSQYVKTIKEKEEIIRKCYAESIIFDSDGFVTMMLVDGCFILEFLLRAVFGLQFKSNGWFFGAVFSDLILLENQLPLFVLEDLYKLNGGGKFLDFTFTIRSFSFMLLGETEEKELLRENSKGKCSQIIEDLLGFVREPYCCSSSSRSSHGLPRDNNNGECAHRALPSTVVEIPATSPKSHLLDFVRDCFIPSSSRNSKEQLERPRQHNSTAIGMPQTDDSSFRLLKNCFIPSSSAANPSLSGNKKLQRPHNVTALYKAGVKFEVGSEGKSLLDITFENGVLAIPCICIYDSTESLLRNMIAFEQLHCLDLHSTMYITDYADLLDSLIDTSKDVELLHDHGIIKNSLGDHGEVSLLFNNLVKEVIIHDDDAFYFYDLCQHLNEYHSFWPARMVDWHEWMADLRQTYFKTPWTAISVIAAAVLIVLTFLQTIYTIKQ